LDSFRQTWGHGLPEQAPAPPRPPGRMPSWAGNFRADLTGGVIAALLAIPVSIGYGILALAPLGAEFVAYGVLAGLYAVVFGCLTALLLGANTTMIYAPRSIVTFLIAALIAQNFVAASAASATPAEPRALLALVLLMMLLAGLLQALFGVLRLGQFVKYLPTPVLAGFQNAAAILIFVSQIGIMLGLPDSVAPRDIPARASDAQPLTLLVAVITCYFMLRGARYTRRLAPSLLGFLVGVAAFYLLAAAGLGGHLGPTVGAIPWVLPTPQYLPDFAAILFGREHTELMPLLFSSAASLAIVSSLDAMLCARVIENDSGRRFRGDAELIRIGVGNMVSASFGGISNGINLASSFANHRAGARTALSVLVCALVVLACLLALPPLLALLPRVVIAAMLATVAIQLMDRWTLQMIAKLFRGGTSNRYALVIDLSIVVMVMTFAIAVNIVFAVFLGLFVTIGVFLYRMSKSVIRREYACDATRSRRTREPRLMEALAAHGSRIVVLELEGPLFFGTAENLAVRLDDLADGQVSFVILDFKRVNEIDSTGARIILNAHDKLVKQGKYMLASCVDAQPRVAAALRDAGVDAALTAARVFPDTDRAIEWAEDRLLFSLFGDGELGDEFPLAQFDVLAGMNEEERMLFRGLLETRTYAKGETVFSEGDAGKELYMIAKGSASVRIRLPGEHRTMRLVTFGAGTVFGEIALLDEETRSATVEADEELVCYMLPYAGYRKLCDEHPAIAIRLLANLGRELSSRLRRVNRTIYQLDS
jgi:SulP family sulfate permease